MQISGIRYGAWTFFTLLLFTIVLHLFHVHQSHAQQEWVGYLPFIWLVWQSGTAVEHNDVIVTLGLVSIQHVAKTPVSHVSWSSIWLSSKITSYLFSHCNKWQIDTLWLDVQITEWCSQIVKPFGDVYLSQEICWDWETYWPEIVGAYFINCEVSVR